ncbi:MAG: hypothetical protein DME97_08740 [Verrucomicrobia bacterium]|nr:MAG: hypothetical protein DME97_08740 [Verrucomicrobiota bacterium]
MGLLRTFFGVASAADIVKGIDLGGFFYSDNYKESYPSLLNSTDSSNRSRIAELYLFRAWVTNLGFRVFTSRKEVAERVTYELVNLSNTLGRAVLASEYGVEFDKISNVDYMTLLDSRWQHYDSVLLANQTDESPFADFAIAGSVLQLCRCIGDPISQMSVASGYLIQLARIRQVATARR